MKKLLSKNISELISIDKICTKCHRNMAIFNFRKDSSKSDGYYSSCNDCYKKMVGSGIRGEHKRTHGLSKERIYRTYRSIIERCTLPSAKAYKNYGGRGIKCEWESFEDFFRDMCEHYEEGLEIDRKDVNGNYCKDNCRWVDLVTQARNKRNVKQYEYKGELLYIPEIEERFGVKRKTFFSRIKYLGYTVQEAIEKPMHSESGRKR